MPSVWEQIDALDDFFDDIKPRRKSMKVQHKFTLEAKCPSMPGHVDRYVCTLTTDRMIKVEDIRPALIPILEKPLYQEQIAEYIAEGLSCSVRLEGRHPGEFETTVEVG